MDIQQELKKLLNSVETLMEGQKNLDKKCSALIRFNKNLSKKAVKPGKPKAPKNAYFLFQQFLNRKNEKGISQLHTHMLRKYPNHYIPDHKGNYKLSKLTAVMVYRNDINKDPKKLWVNPETKLNPKMWSQAKECGRIWSQMTDIEKAPYIEEFKIGKAKYDIELKAWKNDVPVTPTPVTQTKTVGGTPLKFDLKL